MASYNTIKGLTVKYLSADPANPEDGQVWYNSTTGNLRVEGMVLAAAWASGGSMGTARYSMTGTGTQTAALGAGGYLPGLSPFAAVKNTEEYDGASWTAGGNMTYGRHEAGMMAGSQTAAIIASGFGGDSGPTINLNNSETYDGSAWTATPSLNTARRQTFRGMGSQAAAVCIGGYTTGYITNVEEYNGTWTNVTAIPTAKGAGGCSGTQTAGVIYGGSTPTSSTFEYDGSSWTAGGSLPTTMTNMANTNGPQGTQTAAGSFGGNNGATNTVSSFIYNGTSWLATANMATARSAGGGAGSTTAGLAFGGADPGRSAATEEFTGATVITKSITTS